MTVYKVQVEVVNPENTEERKTLNYDCRFFFDPEQYGNGTYLHFGNDRYYDIRYDTDYQFGKEIQYLCNICCNSWTGENGSWILKKVSIEETHEEERD